MSAAALGDAILRISADIQQFNTNMNAVGQRFQQFGLGIRTIGGQLQSLGVQALALSASLAGIFAPAVLAGSEFEQRMKNVKAVLGELSDGSTDAESKFASLTQKALELGATTRFSAIEAATAMEQLALAGFNADQVLSGIDATLLLATAGSLDLARAAEINANMMNSFKLEASDLNRVADVLAQTANRSTTDVNLLGDSFALAAPAAFALGQSMEETAAALGVLANAGLRGSVAGAGLEQVLAQLAKKAEKVDEVTKKYGLTFADVDPQVHSLRDILKQFIDVNISAADAMQIFGSRAARSFLLLKNQGLPTLDAMIEAENEATGAAERMAAVKLDTVQSAWAQFRNAIGNLNIAVFDAIRDGLMGMLKFGTDVVKMITDWVNANPKLVAQLFMIANALAAGLAVISGFALGVGTVVAAIGGFFAVGGQLIGIAALVVAEMTALGAVFSAILVPAFAAVANSWDALAKMVQSTWENFLKPIWEGFSETFTAGIPDIQGAFERLSEAFQRLFQTIGQSFSGLASQKGSLTDIGSIIAELLVTAVIKLIEVLETLINITSLVAQAQSDLGAAFSSNEGFWHDAIENAKLLGFEYVSIAERLEQTKRTQETFLPKLREINEEGTKSLEISRDRRAMDEQLMGLLERQSELNSNELQTMEKLYEKGAGQYDLDKQNLEILKQLAQETKHKIISTDKLSTEETKRAKSQLAAYEKEIKFLTDLIERHEKLVKTYDSGQEGRDKQVAALEENNVALTEEIATLEKEMEIQIASGNNVDKLKQKRADLAAQIDKQKQAIIDLNSVEKGYNNSIKGGEDAAARRAAVEAELAIRAKMKEVAKDIAESDKAFAKMGEDLDNKKLTGLAKELEAIKKTEAEYLELAAARLELYNQELANAELNTERAKKASDERALTAALEAELEIRTKIADIGKRTADIMKRAADDEAKALKEAAEGRADALRDLEIEDKKARGKILSATVLENQKLLEEEKKKNDKIFELDGKNDERIKAERLKAEELFKAKLDKRLRDAGDKEAGKKDVNKSVEREADLESKVTGELASQVRTIQDMIALYQALAFIRDMQERRAFQAAANAGREEIRLARFKERREALGAAGGDTTELDRKIAIAERTARLADAVAVKRAGEAKIAPEGLAAGDAEAAKAKFDAMTAAVTKTLGDIESAIDRVGSDVFGAAPGEWIDIFVSNWEANSQRMVDAVLATMSAISLAMDPSTRHSPSLIDVWDMNIKEVKSGITRVGQTIQENMPNLSQLNLMQASVLRPKGLSTGGMETGAFRTKEFNDNRRVQMDIHNNVDIDNVKRQIGRSLIAVKMSSGGI